MLPKASIFLLGTTGLELNILSLFLMPHGAESWLYVRGKIAKTPHLLKVRTNPNYLKHIGTMERSALSPLGWAFFPVRAQAERVPFS